MATTEWQPSFKKCFHTTVCVSSFAFVVQLFVHFLRVYYCCYRAFTLAWFWPTESIQTSRKRTAKEKQGERRNCKCQAHVLPPPLLSTVLEPFLLSSCRSAGHELCIGLVWDTPGVHSHFAQVCVCLYVCAGGVNYQTYIWSGRLWGREMPEHDFPSFFCLPLTLSLPPFSPSLHSSVISVTPRRPRFSIDSNSVLSALLWIPSFHLALWMAEKNRGENWPFLSLLSLSLHVSVFVCVRLFVRVCGGGCGVDIG